MSIGECIPKFAVEGLAVLFIPLVHKKGLVFLGGGSGLDGVRVGFEGDIQNGG